MSIDRNLTATMTAQSFRAKARPQTLAANSSWLRGPGFDLAFVVGGAFFTLAVAAIAISNPRWLPMMFWIWIVGFEGSHFWATFSRTYIDRKFRAANGPVLIGSLGFFVLPALTVLYDLSGSSVSLMALYGFFIFVWSLYHNARQHYGFLSIYAKKLDQKIWRPGQQADLRGYLTVE